MGGWYDDLSTYAIHTLFFHGHQTHTLLNTNQIREWKEGKCLVFDDAYEHEVWNKTGEERVLLLVDFWHVSK